jgi:hypothetical protein
MVRQIERDFPSGHDHTMPNGHNSHKANICAPTGHESCQAIQVAATAMIAMTLTTKMICVRSFIAITR